MKTCKVCGKSYRAGTLAVVMDGGKLRSARVCQACVKDHGVTLVFKPAMVKVTEKAGGDERTREVLRNLRAQLKAFTVTMKQGGGTDDFIDGKVEGLETAIAALSGGKG